MVKEGDKAPAVIGTSYDGTQFDIGSPARRTVLFFYPKASTPGCTVEAIEFTGLLDEFAALGVQVIGASVDSAKANRAFAEKYGLRSPLLCDTTYELSTAFGVARPLVGVAKRTTFVLDTDGTVRRAWRSVTARGHAAEVLAAMREIWP